MALARKISDQAGPENEREEGGAPPAGCACMKALKLAQAVELQAGRMRGLKTKFKQ